MSVKVAINGFGRIGRLAFRQMFEAEGYEVVAINDLTSPKMLAHLLKYDTAQGGFCGKIGENKHTVEAGEDYIVVDGKKITIYAMPKAARAALGPDRRGRGAGVHRLLHQLRRRPRPTSKAGAKKVVISAPAGNDLPTIVYSVNEKTLTKEDTDHQRRLLHHQLPGPHGQHPEQDLPHPVSGIMTTVHAYTGDQMILDGPQRKGDRRRARAGAAEHRAQLHRRRQGHRPGHPRAERQADRLCPARACSHRLHHHPGGCGQGQGRDQGEHQRRHEGRRSTRASATTRRRSSPPT